MDVRLQRLDRHSICGCAERVLTFLSFFLRKNNFQENILLKAFINELNKLTLKFQIYNVELLLLVGRRSHLKSLSAGETGHPCRLGETLGSGVGSRVRSWNNSEFLCWRQWWLWIPSVVIYIKY